MSLIKVERLTFSYPSGYDNIFENVSFQIDTDWKLGFIGRNGRGKTTFLKLLLGEYEYGGEIRSSVPFDYFPYPVGDKSSLTADILRVICPKAQEWEFSRELSLLDTDAELLWRPFQTLSGGEQTKAMLAALFLNEGYFLLIDEPTNHLDAKGRETVSAYLKKKKGFILVSHDRRFLDECVDHILSFNRSDIEAQSGNFSSWQINFERQQEFERTKNEKLLKDIDRFKAAAKRAGAWSDRTEASKYGGGSVDRGFIGHKSAKLMKRAKSIEARRERAAEQKAELLKNSEKAESLKISPLFYHADTLVSFSGAAVIYDGKEVCEPVSFTLRQGERIALNGRNGCGKSSLLKLLNGEPIKHGGTLTRASALIISYVPQDTSNLSGRLSDYAEANVLDESLFKAILRKLDFERVQFEKDIESFSAGQKKKVLIAKSLCERAHIYLWDEPLNYIDIYSRIQIERLLIEFKPTMIFAEHDRAFREAIATKTVDITGVQRMT